MRGFVVLATTLALSVSSVSVGQLTFIPGCEFHSVYWLEHLPIVGPVKHIGLRVVSGGKNASSWVDDFGLTAPESVAHFDENGALLRIAVEDIDDFLKFEVEDGLRIALSSGAPNLSDILETYSYRSFDYSGKPTEIVRDRFSATHFEYTVHSTPSSTSNGEWSWRTQTYLADGTLSDDETARIFDCQYLSISWSSEHSEGHSTFTYYKDGVELAPGNLEFDQMWYQSGPALFKGTEITNEPPELTGGLTIYRVQRRDQMGNPEVLSIVPQLRSSDGWLPDTEATFIYHFTYEYY